MPGRDLDDRAGVSTRLDRYQHLANGHAKDFVSAFLKARAIDEGVLELFFQVISGRHSRSNYF